MKQSENGRWPPLGGEAALAAALALGAAALAFWRTFYCSDADNTDALITRAYMIAVGRLPYRDFHCPTTPLTYYLLAWGWKLFGYSHMVSQVYAALQAAAALLLSFFFCRRMLGLDLGKTAGVCAAQLIYLPQVQHGIMWYDNDASFFALLGGMLFFRAWTGPDAGRWGLLSGLACAASFWGKQNIGAGAVVGGALGMAGVWALYGKDRSSAAARGFWAGAVLGLGAGALYFAARGGFGDLIDWVFVRGYRIKFSLDTPLRRFLSPFIGSVDRASRLFVSLFIVAFLAALGRFRLGGKREELALAGTLTLWAGGYYAGLLTHGGTAFNMNLAYLAGVLGALWRPWPEGTSPQAGWTARLNGRGVSAAFALCLLILGLRGLKYMTNLGWPPSDYPHAMRAERFANLRRKSDFLDRLIGYIQETVPPEEDFVVLKDNLYAHFATGRIPPTPLTYVDSVVGAIELAGEEERLLRDLRAPRMRWLIYTGTLAEFEKDRFCDLRRVTRYFREEFRLVDERPGFTVFARISAS